MTNKQKMLSKSVRNILLAGLVALGPQTAMAQSVFAPGWTMNTETASLRFQSVKKETVVESSTFGTYTGSIDENGLASIRILMDSVDTNVDLRNVRMRFLMFETFQYPEATVTMQLDPAQLEDLEEVRRKVMNVNYTIDLHGVTSDREAEIAVTLLDNDTVSVTSATPISLPVADFNLEGGLAKLEEAAKVDIIPSGTVTFDFTFNRADSAQEFVTASNAMNAEAGFNVAIEEEGNFSLASCENRFDTMSLTDNIYFARGSSRLDTTSEPILNSIVEIVDRCPDLAIRIGGHTDSDGSEANNQVLSEARAQSVRTFLIEAGADGQRVDAIGYGETIPVVANTTPENKQRNRRIEFSIVE
ncbi:MAG: OmpA family protein [Yoonia sp.]|uniref:OmpA family protein n=1 Tax=Yoonia sp. TaxID=2212373 RepID=UPI0032634FF0